MTSRRIIRANNIDGVPFCYKLNAHGLAPYVPIDPDCDDLVKFLGELEVSPVVTEYEEEEGQEYVYYITSADRFTMLASSPIEPYDQPYCEETWIVNGHVYGERHQSEVVITDEMAFDFSHNSKLTAVEFAHDYRLFCKAFGVKASLFHRLSALIGTVITRDYHQPLGRSCSLMISKAIKDAVNMEYTRAHSPTASLDIVGCYENFLRTKPFPVGQPRAVKRRICGEIGVYRVKVKTEAKVLFPVYNGSAWGLTLPTGYHCLSSIELAVWDSLGIEYEVESGHSWESATGQFAAYYGTLDRIRPDLDSSTMSKIFGHALGIFPRTSPLVGELIPEGDWCSTDPAQICWRGGSMYRCGHGYSIGVITLFTRAYTYARIYEAYQHAVSNLCNIYAIKCDAIIIDRDNVSRFEEFIEPGRPGMFKVERY